MQIFTKLSVILSVLFAICSTTLGHDHLSKRSHPKRHHDGLAVRAPGDMKAWKRFDNARFTYYAVGLGACGQTNQPSDFIVALNSAQYGGGQYCFQMITITVNGKTGQAQIMDECPGCPYGGLDFSEGLFTYFSDLSAGVLYGTWNFGSGSSPTTSTPAPQPTSTWQAPTTTWQAPTTTWTPTTSTTPTSTSTSTTPMTTSTTTSTVATTTTSDALAVETSAAGGTEVSASSVLNDLDLTLLGFGGLLLACEGQ